MKLKKLLGDLTPIVMVNDKNELFVLIKDSKYLVINLTESDLLYDYLDISDIIDNVSDDTKWKIHDLKSGEYIDHIGRVPDEYITSEELVVRLR